MKFQFVEVSILSKTFQTSMFIFLGMFHRGSSFTHRGLTDMATDFLTNWKYTTFPKRLQNQKIQNLATAFVEDGTALYSLIFDFVAKYLKSYFTEGLLPSNFSEF